MPDFGASPRGPGAIQNIHTGTTTDSLTHIHRLRRARRTPRARVHHKIIQGSLVRSLVLFLLNDLRIHLGLAPNSAWTRSQRRRRPSPTDGQECKAAETGQRRQGKGRCTVEKDAKKTRANTRAGATPVRADTVRSPRARAGARHPRQATHRRVRAARAYSRSSSATGLAAAGATCLASGSATSMASDALAAGLSGASSGGAGAASASSSS